MAEGLRYDRQTVGRPSSLAAQKLAKKKAGSWYDKPGEWLEAGIEAANEGMRINDFGQWAKELPVELAYRKPREFIVDPLVRTFTGQEARQNYLNPEGGLRLPERALGVASDALNIASVAPGIKALAAAPQGALKSALSRMAGRRATPAAPPKVEWSPYASMKEGKAGARASQAEYDIKSLLYGSRESAASGGPRLRNTDMISLPPQPPGTIRLWHTNPTGAQLPPTLFSVEEAARMHGRRGDGSRMLLHGGLYTTDNRAVSASYGTPASPTSVNMGTAGSLVPDFLQKDLGRVMSQQGQRRIPDSTLQRFNAARSQAALDKAVDVTGVIDDDAKKRLVWDYYYALSRAAEESGEIMNNAAASRLRSEVDDLFESVKTWDDALNLPGVDEKTWTRTVAQKAAPYGEETTTPLVFRSDKPTMYRGTLVDRDNPYYFLSENPTKVDPGLRQSFALEFARDDLAATQSAYEEQINRYIQELIASGERNSKAVAQQHLAGTPFDSLDETLQRQLVVDRQQNIAKRLGLAMKQREDQMLDLAKQDWANPFLYPELQDQVNLSDVQGFWPPGQNYWDLPIERAGISENVGDITSIGGQRAFDIGWFTPQKANELRDALKAFVASKNIRSSEISDLIDWYTASLIAPERNADDAFQQFRAMISDVAAEVDRAGATPQLTMREDLYNFLNDYLDINAMPHPGGITAGGMGQHQAVAFGRPELLPPAQYVAGSEEAIPALLDQYNKARIAQYNASRVNQNVGRSWQVAPQASRAPIDLSKMLAANMAARPGLNNRKTGTPVR